MKHIDLLEEAENCRRKALAYLGRPEAALLLRLAKEFERTNAEQRRVQWGRLFDERWPPDASLKANTISDC